MEDDNDIWHQLAQTIKPLKTRNPPKERTPVKIARFMREVVIRETPPVLPAATMRPSPIPPRQAKRLQQQKIPVEARIDLHGMTVERAQTAVLRFLTQAWQNETRCVEIVTGRGDPHRGTGQLKRLVPFWLDDPQLRALILHVTQNPASRGGSLLVLLRRNRASD